MPANTFWLAQGVSFHEEIWGHFPWAFSMKFLNRKLRPNTGCRVELSRVSNYLGVIVLRGNCPGVIA